MAEEKDLLQDFLDSTHYRAKGGAAHTEMAEAEEDEDVKAHSTALKVIKTTIKER